MLFNENKLFTNIALLHQYSLKNIFLVVVNIITKNEHIVGGPLALLYPTVIITQANRATTI